MLFIKSITVPTYEEERNRLSEERSTMFSTFYPFQIFKFIDRQKMDFSDITVLYGANGAGKTTLLNVIAQKCDAIRHSEFSDSAFFNDYTAMCRVEYDQDSPKVQYLSSDDVFDMIMNVRYLNNDIDDHREQLICGYASLKRRAAANHEELLLHGLSDYDRWKNVTDAASKKVSQSKFVKERLSRNIDLGSNGETAMRYFTEHIDRDSVYILDEPENSLSVDYQLQLKEYIQSSARYYNCQFIISTHSPIFLSLKNANVYEISRNSIERKNWTELDNVRKLFDFFYQHRKEFFVDEY